jgi:hypothetical protein
MAECAGTRPAHASLIRVPGASLEVPPPSAGTIGLAARIRAGGLGKGISWYLCALNPSREGFMQQEK